MSRTTQLVLFVILVLATISIGHTKAPEYWSVFDSPTMPSRKQKDFGIAVMFNDLKQANVMLSLRRIRESSLDDSYKNLEDLSFIDASSDAIRLDLSGRDGVTFVNLPEGLYQITRIDVPHFDLPYKLATDNSVSWRFRVKNEHVNYIGSLVVSPIRSKNSVDVAWRNHFAIHLQSLETLLQSSDILFPIAHGAGYPDPFFSHFKERSNG